MCAQASPIVSVIVEGDNESNCPELSEGRDGDLCLGLQGLVLQNRSLNDVELVMVGSGGQVALWRNQIEATRFARVVFVATDSDDYFEMKRLGADAATSPILAFLDSDVRPDPAWLTSLLQAFDDPGVDISVGLTELHWHGVCGSDRAMMRAFTCLSFGSVFGPGGPDAPPNGFHGNNVALRSRWMQRAPFDAGLLRGAAAQSMMESWRAEGARAIFSAEQRVVHAFTPTWWVEMHQRGGVESWVTRRSVPGWPHGWVTRLGWFEPLVTTGWRIVREPLQWWRYAAAKRMPIWRRGLELPALMVVSILTRSLEALGAYGMLAGGQGASIAARHRPAVPPA